MAVRFSGAVKCPMVYPSASPDRHWATQCGRSSTVGTFDLLFINPYDLQTVHLFSATSARYICDCGKYQESPQKGYDIWREKNQQDATIRRLLLTSISTCFGHHYAHLQENKEPVTAFGVLFWFCWMWLVADVGRCFEGSEHYEGFCSMMPETCWDRS